MKEHVFFVRCSVRLRGKSDEAFIVHVNLERIEAGEQDVEPDVKFALVDEERIVDVF